MLYQKQVQIPMASAGEGGLLFIDNTNFKPTVRLENDAVESKIVASSAKEAFQQSLELHKQRGDNITGEACSPLNGAGESPEYFVAFYCYSYSYGSGKQEISGKYYLVPAKNQSQAYAVMCQEHKKPNWLKPVRVGKRTKKITTPLAVV